MRGHRRVQREIRLHVHCVLVMLYLLRKTKPLSGTAGQVLNVSENQRSYSCILILNRAISISFFHHDLESIALSDWQTQKPDDRKPFEIALHLYVVRSFGLDFNASLIL